ncbi:MAG: hypothetical protein JNK76_05735 [Planctomycetales bacterium]|nr:hypothetical protein [Planctomycetales bacterium]MBN8623875.1 hypothetical protein [Planctomycetota bacterium]
MSHHLKNLILQHSGFLRFATALAVVVGCISLTRLTADEGIVPVKATTSGTAAALKADGSKSSKGPKGPQASKALQGFTPEREAAALTFVRAHHPELAELLDRLKTRRPQEYQKAVRELFRASERLAQSQEMQPLRYEMELNEWKLQSRIQLLVARMSMGRTPEQEAELRQLLAEQLAVHRELVKFTHERTAARAAALQKELDELDADREQLVERRYQEALKTAGRPKPAGKATPSKNGAAKPSPGKSGDGKSGDGKPAEKKPSESP